jgi:hypothetical protein
MPLATLSLQRHARTEHIINGDAQYTVRDDLPHSVLAAIDGCIRLQHYSSPSPGPETSRGIGVEHGPVAMLTGQFR